ncbi:MAG: LysR family transcriptional regulator [Hyphomicrobiaceae bacterium]|nr:LysR family transcriptional regulator [Hyphomicrobiaceae bacterium]
MPIEIRLGVLPFDGSFIQLDTSPICDQNCSDLPCATIPKVHTVADRKRSVRADWEDLRVLIELARQGSLSAAARVLGVTHATVSRRIANLERDLAQPLFVREGGRYTLTEAGKRILTIVEPMSASAEGVLRAAAGFEARLTGPVRITATEAVATYIVLPALKAIRLRYPDLDLVLNISQINLNLARSDADIAVRLSKPEPDSDLIGTKIAEMAYHLYGSRSYVDGRKPELFEFIGYQREYADWPEAKALDSLAGGGRTALKVNHLGNRIEAARLGLGLALIPSLMAEAWPDLVRVSRGGPVMSRDVYVIVHSDVRDVPRIKACYDVLTESIVKRAPLKS